MTKKEHHVVPSPQGGWNVKKAGSQKASGHFETKAEAVKEARQISQNQKTELVIHNQDGKIAQKDSHGHDSCPPRG
jgi:uncharacterized protein YdaT